MNCHKCGLPVAAGNSIVVRRKGKRSLREHRTCPAKIFAASLGSCSPPIVELVRPSEPRLVKPSEPDQPRFFISEYDAERLRHPPVMAHAIGMSVVVHPVQAWQIERDPDQFAHMVEIEVK